MTKREVLERLYEEGSFEGEHRDIHPDRIEIALQELAQIEESERLSVEMIERIVKINLPIGLIGKEWPRDVAQAIYEAQRAK